MIKALSGLPIRTKLLLGVLVVSAALAVGVRVQNAVLERSLLSAGQDRIHEIEETGNEVVYHATVSRPLVLFGPAQGKIRIYVRPPEEGARIHSVDYFYTRGGSAWEYTGSGASAGPESDIEGKAAFAGR